MTTDFMICNRKKPRWSMAQFEGAYIALDAGQTFCRFTLLDASGDGISFFIPTGAPEIQESLGINAAVHVGDGEIQGVIGIVHMTPSEEGVVCGATFSPTSEVDERNWHCLIADLAAGDRPDQLANEPTSVALTESASRDGAATEADSGAGGTSRHDR